MDETYERRIAEVFLKITLISDPIDLLYMTGLSLSRGLLILGERESRLYVDSRYIQEAKKQSKYSVHLWEKEGPFEWIQSLSPEAVIFDSKTSSYDTYLSYQKFFQKLEPVSGVCKKQRMIKNQHEIDQLQKAAELTHRGILHVKQLLRKGVMEIELAWEFEKFVRERGATGLSFEPIIAFGEASAAPHHRACKAALHDNQIVLIDVGAVVGSYRGDLTRVEFFGTPDPILEKRLRMIQMAAAKAIDAVRPGMKVGDLDRLVRDDLKREGVESLFTHSLGHGIGLETHESPLIRSNHPDSEIALEEDMVFTIEPGLYEAGRGGVRFEQMVLVRNGKGCVLGC